MSSNPTIIGTGSYAPDRVMTNEEIEEMVDTTDEWIRKRTGIERRHIAGEEQASSDLGLEASMEALEDAEIEPSDLDMIVVATSTSDMTFPSTSCILQDKLGLNTIGSYDVGAGCSGFIYALSTAQGQILSGVAETVLVVGTEVTSRFNNWNDRSTCILFGDGAGAVVLQDCPDNESLGLESINLHSMGEHSDILKRPAGGSAMPIDHEILEKGLQYVEMDGSALFKIAVRKMGEVARECLDNADRDLSEIDWIVPHQANLRIIDAVSDRLDFPYERIVINVDEYGNTSAASVPLAFDEAHKDERIESGDFVLLIAFGAGITWAGTIIHMP